MFIFVLLGLIIVNNVYFSASKLLAKSSISLHLIEDAIAEDEVFHLVIKDEREIELTDVSSEQGETEKTFILAIPEGVEFEQQLQTEKEASFNWNEGDRKLLISLPAAQKSGTITLRAEAKGVYTTTVYAQESSKEKDSLNFSVLKNEKHTIVNAAEVTDDDIGTYFPDAEIENVVSDESTNIDTNINTDEYYSVYNWDQLVEAVSNSSVTKIILMDNIFAVGTSNFSSRTENLEINGNGFTLSLNNNSMILGNLSSGVEKTFHFNNITILFSNTGSDFIRANDSTAGGRWRILLEDTTISGSRRAVDARRSEVTLKGNIYIRTRRSNLAMGSLVVDENARYTSIVFNSNRAAVWFPRNVSGAAVTGTNSEFRVKEGAQVNFYRENNTTANQPAVFRHFRSYVIEKGAKVNYFYQNQNGGVAPLGDQSAANSRPQAYTILNGAELNIYTSNQMGIHFRRRDTSLVTESGGKMNVLLVAQNNNIVPDVPVSPDEGGEDDEEDENDGDEDEPDVSLNTLINLAGTRTSITITDPKNLDVRSNAATDLFFLSSTSVFTINNAHMNVWQNPEFFWKEPSIAREDVVLFSQTGQSVTSTDSLLMSLVNVTSNNYKRITAMGTTIYEDEQAEIKVSYIDENANTIFPDEIIIGRIDSPKVIESAVPGGLLETSNYSVKSFLTTNGRYDEETFEFTPDSSHADLVFVLEAKDKEGIVDVRYQAEDDTLLANETIKGVVGMEYITEAREFDGWELVEVPSNAAGIFTEETIIVTYLYRKVLEDAILTVEFINELEQLLPGYTLTINAQIGDEVDLTKNERVVQQLENVKNAGYEIIERPENETSVKINTREESVRYKVQGVLSLTSVPQSIDFGIITYDATNKRVEKPEIDRPLVVSDTRADNTNGWTLTASLSKPMRNGAGEELMNALRYVYQGKETILDENAQIVYLNAEGSAGSFNISDSWGDQTGEDGVKLQIASYDTVYTGNYVGIILWKVMAGQP